MLRQKSLSFGQTFVTPAAIKAIKRAGFSAYQLLSRHRNHDWGDLDEEDRHANEEALASGARVFSVYKISDELTVWVITEAEDELGNRASTTILLPEDY